QGIELGLIRTQELLAARRIDGAEQFFTSAFDFGYSKSEKETFEKWDKQKILGDVVWVIRTFRPHVIITRFPTTGEGGHGHHTASATLAEMAFEAASDPNQFPEQLKQGASVWITKRLLWNTFNFGGNNTKSDDQLKINVGMYNPILGKSYGEMAAESRSQHKSQGFGVPAQRGVSNEFFETIKGNKPISDFMEGIETGVASILKNTNQSSQYNSMVKEIVNNFDPSKPAASLSALEKLYDQYQNLLPAKATLIKELIAMCAGLYMEATVANQLNVIGDSIRFTTVFNNRNGVPVQSAQVVIFGTTLIFDNTSKDITSFKIANAFIPKETPVTQPYWLQYSMKEGSFDVRNQTLIGLPENKASEAVFQVNINQRMYNYSRPIQYKYTDPVRGELYQPMQLVNPVLVNVSPSLVIVANGKNKQKKILNFTTQFNQSIKETISIQAQYNGRNEVVYQGAANQIKGTQRNDDLLLNSDSFPNNSNTFIGGMLKVGSLYEPQLTTLHKISYEHIPDIYYNSYARTRVVKMDLNISGSRVGYIVGAGDKVPEALSQMGYDVVMLNEKDITTENIQQLDAIVTGVRAYNTNTWLSSVYDVLMQYVKNGGVLLVQYNTNKSFSTVRANISPYPFTISRNRITDEQAAVNFLIPNHSVLNYPNKISDKDFDGWIQERSIYNAENVDESFQKILSMKDPGESAQSGSLIVANYGKGRFVYTGLVFFRQLPAGVSGAYRLLANLIAKPIK
ncbi:MAG: PIG-L family deacetylase, partial [Ferruginibacter sp.]